MKFELFRSRNKQWRWRLRSSNGKIVANAGESYKRRVDCMKAIELVMMSSEADVVDLEAAK